MYQIAIVIFDDFTDVDFFLMRDVLGRSQKDWTVSVLGTKPQHHSALGMAVKTDGPLDDANKADVVLFTSGYKGVPAALADEAFLSAFRLDPKRQLIGSICAGAYILQALGLLDGIQATTHPDAKAGLVKLGVDVLDKPLVVAGNIATAGGCLSSMYLTGWIAECLYDADKRREVQRQLIPAGQQAQFEALIAGTIAEAIPAVID